MSTYAKTFEALLTSQRAGGATLANGKAYFYGPGTTTLKAIYTDRNKTTPAANPITLSADGTAQIFGDGLYDVKLTNSALVQKAYWEDVSIKDQTTASYQLSDYGTLTAAQAAIGSSNPARLNIDENITVSADTTLTANIGIEFVPGKMITVASGKTLTVSEVYAGMYQVFAGTGTVKISKSTVYPEWFGAKLDGVTDDTVALQRTFTTGAFNVSMRAGTYISSGIITISDDINLYCEPGTIIDFSAGGYLLAQGTISAVLGTLQTTTVKGTSSIVTNATSGITNDDTIIMWDTADNSYVNFTTVSVDRTFYRNGEMNEVLLNSAGTITLKHPLRDAYPSTDTVNIYKLNGIRVRVENLQVKGGSAVTDGMRIRLAQEVDLINVSVVGGRDDALRLDRCYKVRITGGNYRCNTAADLLQYGMFVGNSQHVTVTDATIHGARHGFTTGGQADAGSVPCRDIFVIRCHMSSDVYHSADTHGNTENAVFTDCTATRGIGLGGENIRWVGGNIYKPHPADDVSHSPIILTEVVGGLYQVRGARVKYADGIAAIAFNDSSILGRMVRDVVYQFSDLEIEAPATALDIVLTGSRQPPTAKWEISLTNVRHSGSTLEAIMTASTAPRTEDGLIPPWPTRVIIQNIATGATSGFKYFRMYGSGAAQWTGCTTRFTLPTNTVRGNIEIPASAYISTQTLDAVFPEYPTLAATAKVPTLTTRFVSGTFNGNVGVFAGVTAATASTATVKLFTAATTLTTGSTLTKQVDLVASCEDLAILEILIPVVTAFVIPATSSSLTVPITTFTAVDSAAVTGYLITESDTKPGVGDAGWSATPQTSYVFASQGSKTLYAWAKDAAGNVSDAVTDSVVITL